MVQVLLSTRWLSFRNTLLRGSVKESRSTRLSILFTMGIGALVGWLAYSVLTPLVAMGKSDPAVSQILSRLPALGLFTGFWMLLLSGVTVALQKLYINPEIPLLLSAPVRPHTLLAAKLIECTFANASLFLLLAVPMSIGWGIANGNLTMPFICTVALALFAFSLLPTSLGIVLSFLLMRALPANRTRDLLGALGVAAFACAYFVLSVAATRSHNPEAILEGTRGLLRMFDHPIFRHGPWALAGASIVGGPSSGIALTELICLAALSAVAAGLVANKIYWRSWATLQESSASISVKVETSNTEERLWFIPSPLRAILLKDLRNLRRDLRQLSMLLVPMAVVAVYLVQISEATTPRGGELLLMAGLLPILAMISLRLAMSAFVAENRAIWLVLGAPNDARTVLLGKFLYAYVLAAPLAGITAIAYAVLMQLAGRYLVWALALALCSVAGFCGIGVGSSALFTDFNAESAKSSASAGGRLVTFAFQMGYLVSLAVILIAARLGGAVAGVFAELVYLAAGLLIVAASLTAILFPIALGANRMRNMEW